MKLIKYFSRELVEGDLNNLNKGITNAKDITDELKFEIIPLEYKCIDEEFNYWLDVIEKTYGIFEEITTEDVIEPPTEEEVMTKSIVNLKLENLRKDKMLKSLGEQITLIKLELLRNGGNK